jgi:hypothetical protein
MLPNLHTVQFCGNLGDPCASKIINNQLSIIKEKNLNLQLHTNGSLRTVDWWAELAILFGDKIEVWFAIDGLEDTHAIYRQANQLAEDHRQCHCFYTGRVAGPYGNLYHSHTTNIRSKTVCGCPPVWDFIDLNLSRMLDTNQHFDYQTGEALDIKPWSQHESQWQRRGGILDKVQKKIERKTVLEKDCMHLAMPSIFLNASGVISPCCYFGQRPLSQHNIREQIQQKRYQKICLSSCGSN